MVERHLGDAGFGEDGVNTGGPIAVPREQAQRGVYELFALPAPVFVSSFSACEMALSDKQFCSGSQARRPAYPVFSKNLAR